jgi:hypothetical protein
LGRQRHEWTLRCEQFCEQQRLLLWLHAADALIELAGYLDLVKLGTAKVIAPSGRGKKRLEQTEIAQHGIGLDHLQTFGDPILEHVLGSIG